MAKASEFIFLGLNTFVDCYKDNENLKQPFGRMDTLTLLDFTLKRDSKDVYFT